MSCLTVPFKKRSHQSGWWWCKQLSHSGGMVPLCAGSRCCGIIKPSCCGDDLTKSGPTIPWDRMVISEVVPLQWWLKKWFYDMLEQGGSMWGGSCTGPGNVSLTCNRFCCRASLCCFNCSSICALIWDAVCDRPAVEVVTTTVWPVVAVLLCAANFSCTDARCFSSL